MMLFATLMPLLVGLAAARVHLHHNFHPLSDAAIAEINSKQSTWTAGRNFDADVSMTYIRRLMGVREDHKKHRLPELKQHTLSLSTVKLPASFDAREKWPECASVISHIRDQGSCGSCWAVAAAAAMTDRQCVASKGASKFVYSAEDLVSCCSSLCGYGCDGGYPDSAWKYWMHYGLVSGDDYNNTESCKPYSIPPCEHHVEGDRPNCSDMDAQTPKCVQTCNSAYSTNYKDDRHFGKQVYSVKPDQESIMRELMTHGPMEASFTVYEDFLNYKSGVYQHVSGDYAGGHAVKLVGWGEEKGTPYWLFANSWNNDWGENGFFKMIRGKNEGGIEASIVAGTPKL